MTPFQCNEADFLYIDDTPSFDVYIFGSVWMTVITCVDLDESFNMHAIELQSFSPHPFSVCL